jgi:chaperonin cofactor prefoldin
MASVRAYMAGLVVLAVVAVVFAVLWFMAYTNYTSLETKYANLQSRYNTLEANYTNLKTNYNNLQSQYQTLQSQYSSLQTNYTTLQNQYQALEANYSELNNTYWELFTALGQSEWYRYSEEWGSSLLEEFVPFPREWITAPANSTTAYAPFGFLTLEPDKLYYALVVVPSNFSARINIMLNATAPLDVYVFNLSNYVQWLKGYSPPYYFYAQGKLINGTVTVPGPGIYIVVLYNPSNTTMVELYYWSTSSVTAKFIQTSG